MNSPVLKAILASLLIASILLAWQHSKLRQLRARVARLTDQSTEVVLTKESPAWQTIPQESHGHDSHNSTPLPSIGEILAPFDTERSELAFMVRSMPVVLDTMENCTIHQILTLIDQLQEVSDPARSKQAKMVASFLLILIGEQDPERILRATETEHLDEGTRQEVRLSAFSKLAELDPRKARAILDEASWATESTLPLRSLVMGKLAETDLVEALDYVQELGPEAHPLAVSAIGKAAADAWVRSEGWKVMAQTLDTSMRSVLSRGLIRGEFKEGGLESVTQALTQHQDLLDSVARNHLIIEAATVGLKDAPEAMIEFMERELTGEIRSTAMKGAVSIWANRDYNAVGAWLGTRPSSPERDAAIMAYASVVAKIDPNAAMAWTAEIVNHSNREAARNEILSRDE